MEPRHWRWKSGAPRRPAGLLPSLQIPFGADASGNLRTGGRWYLEGHDPTTDRAGRPASRGGRTGRGAGRGRRRRASCTLLYARQTRSVISDWDPTWAGTRALLQGREPVRRHPGAAVAQLAAVPAPRAPAHGPVHVHPARLSRAGCSPAIGAAAFTYVITARGRWTLYFLISGAMLWSWIDVQWPPLLIAAALVPNFSWMLAAKPTLGLALWCAYPNRKAVIGRPAVRGRSASWSGRAGCRSGWHRWRGRPTRRTCSGREASCCCSACSAGGGPRRGCWRCSALVPQTTALYETLPLALVADTRSRRRRSPASRWWPTCSTCSGRRGPGPWARSTSGG